MSLPELWFLCTILPMTCVTWGLCLFFSPHWVTSSAFLTWFPSTLGKAWKTQTAPYKGTSTVPLFTPTLLLCPFFFPQRVKMRQFTAGLSWMIWLKSNSSFRKVFESREKSPESRRIHRVWLTANFFLYFSVWLCNQEINNSRQIQNFFTTLLDMMSPVSKKRGISAWWHNYSGRHFKTHKKYWESREK